MGLVQQCSECGRFAPVRHVVTENVDVRGVVVSRERETRWMWHPKNQFQSYGCNNSARLISKEIIRCRSF